MDHPIRIKLNTITLYLVVAAILIDSAAMYRYLTNSPFYGRGFSWPLGIVCLLYVMQTFKLKVTNTQITRLSTILFLLFIYMFATGYNVEKFLMSYVGVFFYLFIFACALYQRDDMKSFFKAFSNVMFFIAVVSLFLWLFGSILHLIPGRKELSYYWADQYNTTYSYFYLYFENPMQSIGKTYIRNVGVFIEAPGYAGFLTYAMLIEIALLKETAGKKQKKKKLIRIVLFMVTLFTTHSTKGIVAVLLVIVIDYLMKEEKNRKNLIMKGLFSIVLAVAVTAVSFILIRGKLETGSGKIRLDDLRATCLTFIQSPVFGVGYHNSAEIIKYHAAARSNHGLSMGLTVLLAYGGLWLFGIYFGAAVVSYHSPYFKANRGIWLLIVSVLLYNLMISNVAFSDPYIFAVAAAYAAPKTASAGRISKNEARLNEKLSVLR